MDKEVEIIRNTNLIIDVNTFVPSLQRLKDFEAAILEEQILDV